MPVLLPAHYAYHSPTHLVFLAVDIIMEVTASFSLCLPWFFFPSCCCLDVVEGEWVWVALLSELVEGFPHMTVAAVRTNSYYDPHCENSKPCSVHRPILYEICKAQWLVPFFWCLMVFHSVLDIYSV